MCFHSVEAGIEVEERRPRYHGEPRRKRIKFVKDRNYRSSNYRSSDEWALVHSGRPRRSDTWQAPVPPRHNEPENLMPQHQHYHQPGLLPQHQQYHHQHQDQLQLGNGPQQHVIQPQHHQQQHWQPQQHYEQHLPPPPPPPPFQQPNPPLGFPGHDQRMFPGHQNQEFGAGVQNPEEFIPGRMEPRYIEAEPRREREPRASMPPNMQFNAGRNRSRPRGRSPRDRREGSIYPDDSDEDSYRYPRRHSRQPRSLYDTDVTDSFENLQRPRQRSRLGRFNNWR